ncbi:MAG: glycoside hydrolase family 25 protein [Firmicutes bacterium]|nr:glycoside hydrolase family 25 protein [Bacillota bacterium]
MRKWLIFLGAVLCALLLAAGWVAIQLEQTPTLHENPYTVSDFAQDGAFLTCTAGRSSVGIDVSSHQQDIDWQAVAASGVEFAFVRVGYRSYSSGEIQADAYAMDNLTQAQAAGLAVGAYFFSQAISVEEALEEAAFALEQLEGIALELPLVYDWEYISESARTGQVDGQTLTDCTIAFCQAVEAAGQTPMVYFNTSQALNMLDMEALAGYGLWLAKYEGGMDFPYRVDFWQYTNTGTVPGITGNVDIDLRFYYDH